VLTNEEQPAMTTTMVHRASSAFWLRLALAAAVVLPIAATQIGCGGCGMAAVPDGPDGGPLGAHVGPNGVVVFDPTPVGTSTTIEQSVKDTANTHERILGASFSGPDAADFVVVGSYPIDVPAGTSVSLQVSFTPSHVGTSNATLMVQTEDMGVSPIQVSGTGS
jgi:hypothetical protein